MTGGAAGRDARVVHRRSRAEGRRAAVTGRAILRCGNVGGGLAHHAARAGVAAGAARGDARAIERASREADEARVAGDAVGRGCNVGRGLRDRRDASEGLAIVTGGAAGRDARVVHRRSRAEGRRAAVTGRAILRCGNVGGGLADHAARAGVAAGAARCDARVIERASREADEAGVAGNAVGRGCDVVQGFETGVTPAKAWPL